jgi:hypothetical protein
LKYTRLENNLVCKSLPNLEQFIDQVRPIEKAEQIDFSKSKILDQTILELLPE